MENFNVTESQLKDIIRIAFKAGENWGVTYSTWFTPTQEDTNQKIENKIKDVVSFLKNEVVL